MGLIFSRFRKKKKTTIEVLECLDSKIKEIQQYGQDTEHKHKKIVGKLVIYSVILYIMTAFIFYFYFFPASLYDQLFYITPLLIFPLLILLTKKMVSGYYKRKISRNQEKLTEMEKEKKKILDEVTETETYKKAKEILLKFAPDQLRMTPLSPQPSYNKSVVETPRRVSTPQAIVSPLPGAGELRRRVLTAPNQQLALTAGRAGTTSGAPTNANLMQTPQQGTPLQLVPRNVNTPVASGPGMALPRPILPQNKSYLDRLVDYLVGDGPANRYALICRQCESHNGMALKEEFEYFGFRCCYCNYLNPARKQKPSAPKLEFTLPSSGTSDFNAHSILNTTTQPIQSSEHENSTATDSDSDIEVVEKPSEVSEVQENDVDDKSVEEETNDAEETVTKTDEIEEEEEEKEKPSEEVEKMEVDDLPVKT